MAMALRQKAIASAGAAVAAISGPDVETPSTPTAMSRPSVAVGVVSAGGPAGLTASLPGTTPSWTAVWQAHRVGRSESADESLAGALVAEAMRRSGICWILVPGQSRARPAWHVWEGGAAYVVAGNGEQPLPGLAEAADVTVTVPSKTTHGRLVTWTAAVRRIDPGHPERDTVVGALRSSRLNLSQPELTAWPGAAPVVALEPNGTVTEGLDEMPPDSLAAVPPETPATTRGRLPWVLHRRPRSRPRLS